MGVYGPVESGEGGGHWDEWASGRLETVDEWKQWTSGQIEEGVSGGEKWMIERTTEEDERRLARLRVGGERGGRSDEQVTRGR